ncbi:hypothetical protein PPACK8108_LOCUS3715 [Phakopsora pachyrhizi]|uniref:Uncharacterized protein n=1 Tax=Phakopsora pachyrhizi TaxID=170000 RepID=A0AAV0AKI6_PHAPC|nr:hypothetical protein PPACK8108_LOCUS3715 [Phakopsora pachyrhizi]
MVSRLGFGWSRLGMGRAGRAELERVWSTGLAGYRFLLINQGRLRQGQAGYGKGRSRLADFFGSLLIDPGELRLLWLINQLRKTGDRSELIGGIN